MLHPVPEGMLSARARCPRCGSTIPHRAALGLCPACLMNAALTGDAGDADLAHPFPYRIITLLAGDAAAVTYLAHTLGGAPRHVALKIVRPCSDPAAVVARFDGWKNALADCRHPGLSTLVDAGTLGADSVYLAAGYIPGSALAPLVRSAAFDRDQRGEIVRQLAAALRAIHARGLAHMRLDPSRIKIASEPDLRVIVL